MNLVYVENMRMATGGIAIDRLEYELGSSSQPDEDPVEYRVAVSFEFEVQ